MEITPAQEFNKELSSLEYTSLRDEMLKWQDRRILFSQIALTLVTVYTGYLLPEKKDVVPSLSWQVASVFPLLILSVTIHITRIFELFQIRISVYIGLFYKSNWENNVGKVLLSEGRPKVGYNLSMALIYFFIALTSCAVFGFRYPNGSFGESILFIIAASIFTPICLKMALFKTKDERLSLVKRWQQAKEEMSIQPSDN